MEREKYAGRKEGGVCVWVLCRLHIEMKTTWESARGEGDPLHSRTHARTHLHVYTHPHTPPQTTHTTHTHTLSLFQTHFCPRLSSSLLDGTDEL
jgi:hypothetical protein